ncbi:SusD/RagB family nutrient-binding outer membrane lipoprotein [Parapedobacter lycopersici]|uniref:SusD/RagB family nutrient-binding outer membrane lipoprotein n=1 Tax=Parapedobacter lycopersici TaxID=1864939 RepID=UPI00214D93B5|nr:SusD/RagB family nutrient-binding outer membrane lipoprotein [Parapedobacter lycopersici]
MRIKGSKWFPTMAVAALLIGAAGCTKNFEDLNTNPGGVTDEEANADYTLIRSFLAQAQRNVIYEATGNYQLANNLASDAYAGYLAIEAQFEGNSNNLTYRIVPVWTDAVWDNHYILNMSPLERVSQSTRSNESLQDIFAFSKLLRVASMHRVSDKLGPIIYTQYNKPNETGGVAYDAQPELFNAYFADLDTAMNIFKELKQEDTPVSTAMSLSDIGYTGDNYTHLLKVTNTLRLRLAMRLSKVDPELARTQGEKALDPANGGLLEDVADNWSVALSGDHPLTTITDSWSDTRMAAELESHLVGYDDPRLPKLFRPATDPVVAGQYKGIRGGIQIDEKSRYDNYSKMQPLSKRMQLMVASEAWFLKAEAALRGWANAGDAKTNYETGIAKSFEMYGVSGELTAYLNDDTKTPAAYVDPKAIEPGENDVPEGSPYLSTVTIKWDEAASNDEKLERIITQKWLAIFPDGDEAWAEQRRTGYPIQFPVVLNYSNGQIDTEIGIRRMKYSQREYNSNSAAVNAAVDLLGGPDNGGTRLWWDVEDKSF